MSTIHRWTPTSGVVTTRKLDLEYVTMALPFDGDRSLVASRESLHEFSWSTETLVCLGSWRFSSGVRFNDGALAPNGDVYVGTMSMDRQPSLGTLFRFQDGQLIPVVEKVGISNGLGWMTEGRAYYVDSMVPRINLLTLGPEGTRLGRFADLDPSDEPDGLVVTPNELLVALWDGSRLARWTHDGNRLDDVEVPVRRPTAVAVGGSDGDTLFVTTADVDGLGDGLDGLPLVTQMSSFQN